MLFRVLNKSVGVTLFAIVLTTTFSIAAYAAGKHAGGHGQGHSIGKPGKPQAATRTIEIKMIDNEFKPKSITVVKGETVRFVVVNRGEFVHEFNIGTAAMHQQHQKEMLVMMDKGILEADRINHHMMKSGAGHMAHDDPTVCSWNRQIGHDRVDVQCRCSVTDGLQRTRPLRVRNGR